MQLINSLLVRGGKMKFKSLDRRKFIQGGSCLPILGFISNPEVVFASSLGLGQKSKYFQFFIGEIEIMVISDGEFGLPMETQAINAESRDELDRFLLQYKMPLQEINRQTNHVVISTGANKILIDVGSGHRFLPSVGKLHENLESAGIEPDSITHVLLTHAHPDHVWGIRDDFDEVVFPNAQYFMGEKEYKWWMQDNLVNQVEDQMQQIVLGAQNSLSALEEITLVGNNYEVLSSVNMIDLPGHTLGHMGVRVENSGKSVIICGDALKNSFLDIKKPNWFDANDMDGDMTVITKKKILEESFANQSLLLAYHFAFPGVGQIDKLGGSYEFSPLG